MNKKRMACIPEGHPFDSTLAADVYFRVMAEPVLPCLAVYSSATFDTYMFPSIRIATGIKTTFFVVYID